MGKLIVVENDRVEGTDKHYVAGPAKNMKTGPPTVLNKWIGDFDYVGKMTGQLSDFVKIDGKSVALNSSKSSLNPGQDASPEGKHSGPMGGNLIPTADLTNPDPAEPNKLKITDQIGEGTPSATSGSSFVKVNGTELLLDGDKIDTCDGMGVPMNSTVTAENQDFVSCSE